MAHHTDINNETKQGTYETYTYKANDSELKYLIIIPYNIKLIIENRQCDNLPLKNI
jgi:hypothetical protein